jgi:hypothetical protein
MMMMSCFVRMHEDLKVMAECNEHISTYSTFKVSWTLSMSPSALYTKSPTFHERSLPTTRFVAQTLMTSACSIQCIAGALTAELHNIYQEGGTARWNSSSSMRMVPSVGIPGTKFSSRASPTSSFVDPFHNSGHWYSRSQKPLARHPQTTSSPSRLYTHGPVLCLIQTGDVLSTLQFCHGDPIWRSLQRSWATVKSTLEAYYVRREAVWELDRQDQL